MELAEIHSLNPFDLESVAYEDRCLLPAGCGVYFALTMPSTVSYIGQSRSIKRRWYRHDKRKNLNLKSLRIAWLPVPELQLREIEEALIRRFNPPLNGIRLEPGENFFDLPTTRRRARFALTESSTRIVSEWDDKGFRRNGREVETYLIGFHAPIVPEPPWLVEMLASCGARMNALYAMQKLLLETGGARFPEHEPLNEQIRYLDASEWFYLGRPAPDAQSISL